MALSVLRPYPPPILLLAMAVTVDEVWSQKKRRTEALTLTGWIRMVNKSDGTDSDTLDL
jgi:hypothetical protein